MTRTDAHRYKVEPCVVAADVYSVAPHAGRGGWTWYTGSTGWRYRAGLDGRPLPAGPTVVELVDDGGTHRVRLVLGTARG